jgi:hypothetical protein
MQQNEHITTINQQDFFNKAVIEPPKEFMYYENNKKYTRTVIDSKDRNTALYQNPNEYEITFDDDINDVVSAQLISADIPFTSYLVNDYFNSLYVTIDGITTKLTLTTGDYTPAGLATHMQSKLNEVSTDDFSVVYDTLKDNFLFKSKVVFTLVFNGISNPLNMLLGFKTQSYTSSESLDNTPYVNVIQSPYRKNFNYNKYVYLGIEQFDLNKGNAKPINKSFAALTQQYTALSINDKPKIVKFFSPTIPRLSKLKISFYDRFGNKYDFQNQDHRLEFLFTSFKQKSKYQNIFGN